MSSSTDNEENDESLMARICNGDHQAFSRLVSRHNRRFYSIAFRVLHNQQDAEDITQDAFIKLWQKPQMFAPDKGARFTTWFYRVVTNMALDKVKQRGRINNNVDPETVSGKEVSKNGEYGLMKKQQEQVLEDAINALPERQKLALDLCFYEGVSNKEAADILGVSVKALESLLIRAKAGVRDRLVREGLLEEKSHGT